MPKHLSEFSFFCGYNVYLAHYFFFLLAENIGLKILAFSKIFEEMELF
jgi:hypothetical protein